VFGQLVEQARRAFVVVEIQHVSLEISKRAFRVPDEELEAAAGRSRADGKPVRGAIPVRVAGVKVQDQIVNQFGQIKVTANFFVAVFVVHAGVGQRHHLVPNDVVTGFGLVSFSNIEFGGRVSWVTGEQVWARLFAQVI